MNESYKRLYERGRFFIETGTANTFIMWAARNNLITRYTPNLFISRISTLIAEGDRDSANSLWLAVCVSAYRTPAKIKREIIFGIIKLVTLGIMLHLLITNLFK